MRHPQLFPVTSVTEWPEGYENRQTLRLFHDRHTGGGAADYRIAPEPVNISFAIEVSKQAVLGNYRLLGHSVECQHTEQQR